MSISPYSPEQSALGKKSVYIDTYDASLLFPIPRELRRKELGLTTSSLPFFGFDLWNHYEVSWLNSKGKPMVAVAKIIYNCDSQYIIESKSMKLYFNSLNNTKFTDIAAVTALVKKDIADRIHTSYLDIEMTPVAQFNAELLQPRLSGMSLDELDIDCTDFHNNPAYLQTENTYVKETLCSDLLKSNCLVTNQPDWCSIQIAYEGMKINHAGLLRYLVSFRNDNEFHEQCIEKVFMHILHYGQPKHLTVYGRSTRRGGLDINSYRSTEPPLPQQIPNIRLCRQ